MAKLAPDDAFRVREFKGDITEPEASLDFVRDLDVIVHLAGANRASDHDILKVNTLGTLNLLHAIRSANPSARLILISSFQVYMQWGNRDSIDESVPPNPLSIYGLSKKFAEELCRRFSIDNGMEVVILRLSNVFGPGCKPDYNSVVATFIHRAIASRPISINGDGASLRDYIFVSDVVDSILGAAVISLGGAHTIDNICSGTMNSLNDIVSIVNGSLEKPVRVEYEIGQKEEFAYNSCSNARAIRDGILKPPLTDFKAAIELTLTEEKRRRAAASP
jgi:UDP-glucose 4-epimerase